MDEFMRLHWRIKEPHELDYGPDFIPDDEISLSYINTGFSKEDPTFSMNEDDKNDNKKKLLVPGYQYDFKTNIMSFLTKDEQGKCLNALKLLQAGKRTVGFHEKNCMDLYNNCLGEILKENTRFLEFAKKQFSINKYIFKIKPMLQAYGEALWKYKLNRCKQYKELFKGIDIIPYSYKDDEEPIEMLPVQNLLDLGTLARFTPPTLLKPYHIKCKLLPKRKTIYNSNRCVSQDINVDKLIEVAKIDVVISSSGLTKLLDFANTNAEWDIPVVVKQYEIKNSDGGTKVKNVVFIDKSFPNKSPSVFELNEKSLKSLLKTNFCDSEAFSFQTVETPVDSYNFPERSQSKSDKIITETDKHNREIPNVTGCNKHKLQTDELQGNNKRIKLDNGEPKIHQNVSYRLWKLQLKDQQCELMKTKHQINSFHVLTRCKLHGCEATSDGQLQPVNIIPKVEYNLKYGAGVPTKSELMKEWVYAHFRPCSQVRRVRTHYNTGEIICFENCTAQKISHDAQAHYQHNPHLGLGVLYKIFCRLIQLTPGDYLLHHLPKDGAFVKLLQETNEGDDAAYNLHKAYDTNNFRINPDKQLRWHPIDVNFVLPRHNLAEQMPGMFKPCLKRFKFTKKKKKSGAKSQNMPLNKSSG